MNRNTHVLLLLISFMNSMEEYDSCCGGDGNGGDGGNGGGGVESFCSTVDSAMDVWGFMGGLLNSI